VTNRTSSPATAPLKAVTIAGSNGPDFFGWRVVGAAFVIAVFGWGTGFYGPPVYLEVVRQARGWPIALISGAMTLHFLVGLALIPTLPSLYRRLGLPIVTVSGSVVTAFGVLGWALASAPWQLYAAALLSGAGWSLLGAVAVNAIVSPWFAAKRPLALGIAFNGGSVGGIIFSPLWITLVDRFGFPMATLAVGVTTIAAVSILARFALTRTPTPERDFDGHPSLASVPYGSSHFEQSTSSKRLNLFRNRAFLTLCAGMTLALFAQTGLVAHLVSVLAPALGRQGAGLAAGASGVAAVAGRLIAGFRKSSESNWRGVASISLLAQALGCVVLILANGHSPALMVLGVVIFGFGVGNAISVPPVIANTEFSNLEAPQAVALIVAISQGAYAIAPLIFGLLREIFSDQSIFFVALIIELLAIIAYLSKGALGATDRR
jgi:MFS family permease